MKPTSQVGKRSSKAAPAAQSKSKSRAGARAGGKQGEQREPEAIIVTCFSEPHDVEARLTSEEYEVLKAFAASRGLLNMAESVKLDAVRSAGIAGFQAGAGPCALKIHLQREDGRAWSDFDLPAETFARLERVCAAQGVSVPAFITEAVLKYLGSETPGVGAGVDRALVNALADVLSKARLLRNESKRGKMKPRLGAALSGLLNRIVECVELELKYARSRAAEVSA